MALEATLVTPKNTAPTHLLGDTEKCCFRVVPGARKGFIAGPDYKAISLATWARVQQTLRYHRL